VKVQAFLVLEFMRYIKELDGVRGIAIILVILFHYNFLIGIGWIGVQLFFVLSGFLITSILLNSKKNNLKFYLKKFYWRRSLRIFPLYYLYIIIIYFVFLVSGYPSFFEELSPYLFTYTYNYFPLFNELKFDPVFTHFWSLSVEEQFYLIWPFIVYFFTNLQLRYILLMIIFLCPFYRFYMGEYLLDINYNHEVIGEIIYRLTPAQIDAFAIGALVPVFNLQKIKFDADSVFLLVVFAFIILGMWNFNSTDNISSISTFGYPIGGLINFQHVWSYSIINFLSLALILIVLKSEESSWKIKFFGNKLLVSIGKVSYGMYVYHWILFAFFRAYIIPRVGNNILVFLSYFFLTYLISRISYNYFEYVFIQLKDKKFIKKVRIGKT